VSIIAVKINLVSVDVSRVHLNLMMAFVLYVGIPVSQCEEQSKQIINVFFFLKCIFKRVVLAGTISHCSMQKNHLFRNKKKIAKFWPPLFAQTQVTYLTFIFLTLQTLAKLKTTFGRNLLYWML
jgi:hypothetical protein